MKRKITIFSVAGVAVLAASAILTGTATFRGEGIYMTDGPAYADVTDLTKASTAVAQVKIVGKANTYRVPFDKAQVVVSPRDTSGDKGKEQPLSGTVGTDLKQAGLLHTDFTVEVVDSVRGSLKKGERITVTQLGGTEDNGAVINTEHDALMQVGAQEVMFLKKDAQSGKFFTTGGGQGRFTVQSNGTLSPVDAHSAIARVATGKPATFITGAAKAAP
jgi:hypothetical protein